MRDGQRMPITVRAGNPGRDGFLGSFDVPDVATDLGDACPARAASRARPLRSRPAPPAPPVPPARGFFDFDELIGRGSGRLGVTVQELQPQLADYFGVRDGLLVTSVTSGSAAEKAGVKAGDVITTLDGTSVRSPADLRQRTMRLDDGAEVTLGVMRDKKALTLKGKVDAASRAARTRTSCSRRVRRWPLRCWRLRAPGRRPDERRELRGEDRGGGEIRTELLGVAATSAAMTPTHPPHVTSGAAIAPLAPPSP